MLVPGGGAFCAHASLPDNITFDLEEMNLNNDIHIIVLTSIKVFKKLSPRNWHSRASTISNQLEIKLRIKALEKKVTNRSVPFTQN